MFSPLKRSLDFALQIAVVIACCWAIWGSFAFARADYLFKQDNEASLQSAIQLIPDGWSYYMRLAQLDRANAQKLLVKSLELNRFNAQANIELGLQYEADGDFGRAEKKLLQAYEVDHTYLPRWSLANYYFRRGNLPAFWSWAQSAAAMPAEDIGALFELCWRASPDPARITAAILNNKPELIRQYVGFLLAKDQPGAVSTIAPHLVRVGTPDTDLGLLYRAVNQLITANDAPAANTLWRLLIDRGWVVADASEPNNATFQRAPLPVSFDWSLPEFQGLHSWPGPSGLQTEFTGIEPEDVAIAEQVVSLNPGSYALSYAYRTSNIPPSTGIHWQILDVKSNTVLAHSPDLSSDELKHSAFGFVVPPGASLFRLRLAYQRTLGTTRISGTLNVQSTQIQALPKS